MLWPFWEARSLEVGSNSICTTIIHAYITLLLKISIVTQKKISFLGNQIELSSQTWHQKKVTPIQNKLTDWMNVLRNPQLTPHGM